MHAIANQCCDMEMIVTNITVITNIIFNSLFDDRALGAIHDRDVSSMALKRQA